MLVIVLGLLASLLVIALGLSIHQRAIALMSVVLSVVTGLQYLLLGRTFTVALTVLTIVYGLAVLWSLKRGKPLQSAVPISVMVGYVILYAIFQGLTFNEELLALLASLSGIALIAVTNPIGAKLLMLGNGIVWVIYQIITGAYGQLPGEAFFIGGVILSLTMLLRARSQGANRSQMYPSFLR